MKKLWYVCVFLALAGILAACAPASQKPTAPAEEAKLKPQYGGSFAIRASVGENPDFDPRSGAGGGGTGYNIHTTVYSGLIRWPFNEVPTAEPLHCDLCERWEQPNDTTYIFYLRKGVKWHNKPPLNGRELTAEDIRWALTDGEGYDSKSPRYSGDYRDMTRIYGAKVEAVDKYTVKITTKEPAASFLYYLASHTFTYPPKEAMEASKSDKNKEGFVGQGLTDLRYAIGTGPFMLKEYVQGISATLERNPDYFRKDEDGNQLPYLDEVRMLYIPDIKVRTNAMLAGRLHDGGIWLDATDIMKLKRAGNFNIGMGGSGVSGGLQFNVDKPPFNDVRVRRAFHLIIDRFEIFPPVNMEGMEAIRYMPSIMQPYGTPYEEVLKLPGYRPDKTKDFEEAKRLLKEAGLEGGFSFTLNVFQGVKAEETTTVVQSQLKPFKLDATLNPLDRPVYRQRELDGAWQVGSGVWTAGAVEPTRMIKRVHSDNAKPSHRWSDPKLDALVEKQERTFDPKERAKVLAQIYDILDENVPELSLWYAPWYRAWDKRFHNVKGQPLHYSMQRWIELVWMEK